MSIPNSMRRFGFKKWYERELLFGHSHLVLVLLCTLALMGGLEAFSLQHSERALLVLAMLVAAVVGAWSLRRFLFMLSRAEFIANQAVCAQCKTYARWDITHDEVLAESQRMTVCCRKCGHRWHIVW